MNESESNPYLSPAVAEVEENVLPEVPLPAPEGGQSFRRRFFILAGTLIGGNLASMVLRIAGGALQVRWIRPEILGEFNIVALVGGYLRWLQLGALNGLNRELPYYIGRKDTARVAQLAGTAKAWALCCGVLVASGLTGTAIHFAVHGNYRIAAALITTAITSFLFFYCDMYLQNTYRTSSDFARLSAINMLANVVGILLISAVVYFGYYGICIRLAGIAIVGFLLLRIWQPIRAAAKLNLSDLKHLLFVGFPMFFVGEMVNWWRLLEGTLIALKIGTLGMGLYSLVLYVETATDMFPTAIGQIFFPRMAQDYGQHHSIARLFRMSHKPSLVCFVMMVPVAVLGWFIAYPMARIIAPSYIGAIEAARWALLSSIVFSFTMVHMIYNIVRRQDIYCTIVAISIGIYYLALKYLISNGATLVAFAQAMIVGRIAFVGLGYVGVFYLLQRESVQRRQANGDLQ